MEHVSDMESFIIFKKSRELYRESLYYFVIKGMTGKVKTIFFI